MKRYILSPEAKTDIINIRKYTIRQWGKAQTEKYTLQLRERMRWLADNPMLGRARDEVKEGYRSFKEGSHIIFYRVAGSAIEIIGIPHQNMDIEQNLSDGNFLSKILRMIDLKEHENKTPGFEVSNFCVLG